MEDETIFPSWVVLYIFKTKVSGSPSDLVDIMMDCDVIVSEFKLHSHYCIHFQTNALRKDMNPVISPFIYGLISTTKYQRNKTK